MLFIVGVLVIDVEIDYMVGLLLMCELSVLVWVFGDVGIECVLYSMFMCMFECFCGVDW